ncbi:MAG: SDR family oxidoreductase [Burkholderiales bacterium]|nr:SDR family oxidoreductase [Burkholderiales bacterium]
MHALPLEGTYAVVTGAGRGIGAAIASALDEAGAQVALLGRDTTRLAAHAATLRRPAITVAVDVADEASVANAFATIRERFPRIDILVNNAGLADSAPFAKSDRALWDRMLGVNLTGTYLCTREVVPAMAKQPFGRIVNVASTAGLVGYAYVAAYCAAKHGVVGLTRALALELAKTSVTVNAVCPGYTETDIVRDAVANIVAKTGRSEADARAALTARNPQGRMIRPEEVASAVLWLCSTGAASITGQAIAVAGGEIQ